MFYNVFFKLKNENEIKKILNFPTKEDVLEKIYLPFKNNGKFEFDGATINREDLEFFQVVETGLQSPEDYENIKRYLKETQQLGEKFLNEKFPNYYAKDITEEL
ncbi:hypothetical protein [Fusobacterium mortiferum]|jgi:hypothetical protein|uniref:Uncharacterized protein n=2 Tax=Fusobacterium mortiferum TaxID=850 RepID=A0A414Q0H3_FUSMR|nr:hypothetical protein [Fusobacterium mortiferum]AVQ18268.1 hypothetical protein C4N19_03935 [Fusobacterium mortiferum ATCC 9817]EEO34501.1 hypothetical protein FMAG_00063 [Fusobacterium mortiferum ATCC 9817]RGM94514.1 hypothetical protein DXB84_12595 [Fusobacterium mortiferum]RHF74301.1 hypothetical protein DW663_02200 [Fusobacterium mortiferum]